MKRTFPKTELVSFTNTFAEYTFWETQRAARGRRLRHTDPALGSAVNRSL